MNEEKNETALPRSVKDLVDMGLSLRTRIEVLTAQLERVEERLVSMALKKEQVELVDEDREGRRYLAHGSQVVVPVVFTADKIRASFAADSELHTKIFEAAVGRIHMFYRLTKTMESKFKDGKEFRAAADAELGKAATAFITACLARDKHGVPKSDTKVMWGEAKNRDESVNQ